MAGKGFDQFVTKVLEPYFKDQFANLRDDIAQYNKTVIETLGSKIQKVKRSNVSFKAAPGVVASCNKCEFSCKSKIQLMKHKNLVHSNSFNIRNINTSKDKNQLTGPKHSTCENSLSEIMNEDISIAAIDTNVTEDVNVNEEIKTNTASVEDKDSSICSVDSDKEETFWKENDLNISLANKEEKSNHSEKALNETGGDQASNNNKNESIVTIEKDFKCDKCCLLE